MIRQERENPFSFQGCFLEQFRTQFAALTTGMMECGNINIGIDENFRLIVAFCVKTL